MEKDLRTEVLRILLQAAGERAEPIALIYGAMDVAGIPKASWFVGTEKTAVQAGPAEITHSMSVNEDKLETYLLQCLMQMVQEGLVQEIPPTSFALTEKGKAEERVLAE
jgi:hypothetical protein